MTSLPITDARLAALQAYEKRPCTVAEINADKCSLTYGAAPCTASGAVGSECYNTYSTCQDKANFSKTTQVIRIVSVEVTPPVGMEMYPYLKSASGAASNIDLEAGISARNEVTLSLMDEPGTDVGFDPYFQTRPQKARGTFWGRWMARNENSYYGRYVKLRRGFYANPWDWNLFLDELYIIDRISVESGGEVRITLKDPLKFADYNKVPLPTSGTLQEDLAAYAYAGTVVSATLNTVQFASDAQPISSFYNGMEVHAYSGIGSGQRRVISSYDGINRIATLSSNWDVIPTSATSVEVSDLKIAVEAERIGQYPDPAVTGKNEYVRIGSEIICYTAISSNTLTFPDSTYRAHGNTTRGDHSASDGVQVCEVFIDALVSEVIRTILVKGGVDTSLISSDLESKGDVWYGEPYRITAYISTPEPSSSLVSEILREIDAAMWYAPQVQKIEFAPIAPQLGTPETWSDASSIIGGSFRKSNLDGLRVTREAMSYALRDSTANLSEARSFLRTDVIISEFEGPNLGNDIRPHVQRSRWFGVKNNVGVMASISRRLSRLSATPKQFNFSIDKKDYTKAAGEQVLVSHFRHVDVDGVAKPELCIITKTVDAETHVEVQARSINFNGRASFISTGINLFSYPYDFDNAAWIKSGSITVLKNVALAPNGLMEADKLVEPAATAIPYISQGTLTIGVQYALSVRAKSLGEGRYLRFLGGSLGAAGESPVFNLDAGTVDVGATNAICKQADIEPIGDGWYLCSAIVVAAGTSGFCLGLSMSSTDNNMPSYLGDGASGLLVWGAKYELYMVTPLSEELGYVAGDYPGEQTRVHISDASGKMSNGDDGYTFM